jgi:argininosuccinate synthase
VIAPWREWDLLSREKLMAYAAEHGSRSMKRQAGKKSPYSMDANLLHISYEGGRSGRSLDSSRGGSAMWRWTRQPGGGAGRAGD